jgi:hypothetical protein
MYIPMYINDALPEVSVAPEPFPFNPVDPLRHSPADEDLAGHLLPADQGAGHRKSGLEFGLDRDDLLAEQLEDFDAPLVGGKIFFRECRNSLVHTLRM